MLPGNFPEIMGILNVTPDSFSDGGNFFSHENAIAHAIKMINDGADIIDIGGESSRPGAESVNADDELRRVIPVIEGIRQENNSIRISIDTVKYEVAEAAIEAGADIINDIGGLEIEPRLAELAAKHSKPMIIMHMKGTPRTMQQDPHYENVTNDILTFLKEKTEFARAKGVREIIIDPGIGFGKSVEHNLDILRNIERFRLPNVKLLLGISRKSFIGKTLGMENAGGRDIATLAYHMMLEGFGGDIIRVHNVSLFSMAKAIYENLFPNFETK